MECREKFIFIFIGVLSNVYGEVYSYLLVLVRHSIMPGTLICLSCQDCLRSLFFCRPQWNLFHLFYQILFQCGFLLCCQIFKLMYLVIWQRMYKYPVCHISPPVKYMLLLLVFLYSFYCFSIFMVVHSPYRTLQRPSIKEGGIFSCMQMNI